MTSGGMRLELRHGQHLVMTPQLQQSIKLLQMSSMELSSFVEQELEKNPLLTRESSESVESSEGSSGDAEESWGAEGEESAASREDDTVRDTADVAAGADFTASESDYGGDEFSVQGTEQWGAGGSNSTSGSGGFAGEGFGLEQTVAGEQTLKEYLLDQLAVDIQDPAGRIIGVQLIDALDESGYLTADPDLLAEHLGCTAQRLEEGVLAMQQLDPPGVFARNLAECLALQLRDKDRLDPAMETLLEHIDLIAKGDIPALCRRCGVDREDLVEMIAEIRALNPKPGSRFSREISQPIRPDVTVRRSKDGGWEVELNSETLPRVLVNRQYYARISSQATGKKDKQYLSEQLGMANWLVKALDQRAQTILKVSSEIVRQQDAFFRHGVAHLKPLILRDIAEKVELHESTVSRVTTSKYMLTPRGIFELKYFFTSAVGSSTGEGSHSSESVKHAIRTLIDAEDQRRILSDDTLAEMLQKQGIDVARRTVAKYREALNIPSSVDRRRQKKLLS